MKNKLLILLIVPAIMLLAIVAPLYAAEEIATPNLPSDFWNTATWPKTHTGSCTPNGKEYMAIAHARIMNDKKVEVVVVSIVNGTIFKYEYVKGDSQPEFGYVYLRKQTHWIKLDFMNWEDLQAYPDLLEKTLMEAGVTMAERERACEKMFQEFQKFWSELKQEAGVND